MKRPHPFEPEADFVPPITPVKLKPGQTMDDRLIRREFYNANSFDLVFIRDTTKDEYIHLSGIPIGPYKIECKPDSHIDLPHAFYQASWADKGIKPENVIACFNFGNDIGKGIKPNREEKRKIKSLIY